MATHKHPRNTNHCQTDANMKPKKTNQSIPTKDPATLIAVGERFVKYTYLRRAKQRGISDAQAKADFSELFKSGLVVVVRDISGVAIYERV